MPTTERDVLDALHRVVQEANVRNSRERGKHFYEPLDLPERLAEYMKEAGLSARKAADMFNISPASLRRILAGDDISENMLFRMRGGLEYASQHPGISLQKDGDTYPGDWRGTSKESVQSAITLVTEKLIYLRDAVVESNSLGSDNAPIDRVQVAQLIALLEATLKALKAPYVDAAQTSGFFKWLRRVLTRGLEKGLEGKVSDALDGAVGAGGELIEVLSQSSGPSDLGSII